MDNKIRRRLIDYEEKQYNKFKRDGPLNDKKYE